MSAPVAEPKRFVSNAVRARANQYFAEYIADHVKSVNRMMSWLLLCEWAGLVIAALLISPRTWNGSTSSTHPHLWAAILAGPYFILPAIGIAQLCAGRQISKHVIAIAQILVSMLLIDITGGRVESHFHIFGSLAFLAFYKDWRVLATASAVTAADHLLRGIWWPELLYGAGSVSPWRWVEHVWWVLFEDFFLVLSVRNSLRELKAAAVGKALLYQGASHDVLTGLANRRLLQEKFDDWLASTPARSCALLFLDLDKFKQVNDTLGHTFGDKLLLTVTKRLKQAVPPSGTLARVGGDEFVIFLDTAAGLVNASELGEKLVRIFGESFVVDGHELSISASIGISNYPEHGSTLAALQESADSAMYVAKSKGRNQCAMFSSEVLRREGMVQELARDLSAALTNGQFRLHFQPIVQPDGALSGFEALVRWTHPVHGPVRPDEFIAIAERSGLILSLGDWVLAEACRTCRTWPTIGQQRLGVAVNVSALQLDQPDYAQLVLRIVSSAGLDPSLLTLEITEGLVIQNLGRVAAQLKQLRDAGVSIALDDFGTGYCSLSYLAELPADVLKLDRSFAHQERANAQKIVASIIQMAHDVGMQVVAEGIEQKVVWERLRAMGCDQFQGYYFGKPISGSDLGCFIEKHASQSVLELPVAS